MILEKIINYKKEELQHYKRRVRLEELKAKVKDASSTLAFRESLEQTKHPFAIIAEIKQKSPSKGLLRDSFDPIAIAKEYQENGAAALSVLTDENFFGGHLAHLRNIRQKISLPLLRKDFIWDPYQVYAAREAGADAILLIAAILEKNQMGDLQGLAGELGMESLIEVHEAKECGMALSAGAKMVGINNRNLKTFKVDVGTTEKLSGLLPRGTFIISESGLDSQEILAKLKKQGVGAFLIGEAFMVAKNPGKALHQLLYGSR